jgi:hypothetical protein
MTRAGRISFLAAWLAALSLPATALAGEGGEGLYGKTDDKVITNFGFGLMAFFVLLVVGLSVLQYLLERRKSRR